MPAPVDHQARRLEVVTLAAELMAARGAEALTVRDVAKSAGCSTSIVSYYFKNKNELLLSMFRFAAENGLARIRAAIEAGHPLETCLESVLPTSDESLRDWKVVLGFWGQAIIDDDFRVEQRRQGAQMLRVVRDLVAQSEKAGGFGELDADTVARTLLTVVVGLATQVVFDPGAWTADRQRTVLREVLRSTAPALVLPA